MLWNNAVPFCHFILFYPGTSNQQTRIGNTVLVKLPNGQTKSMTRIPRRPFELLRVPKNTSPATMGAPKGRGLIHKRPVGADLTPSVSIAPIGGRKMGPHGPMPHQRHSDSDEDNDDRKPMLSPPMTAQRPKGRYIKMYYVTFHIDLNVGKQPVQTIDISSDDDCVVVSEPEGDDEDEPDDDPTNSGMHTNDGFNQPDEQGRVLVNVGHHEEEPDVFVATQISRIIKPHQIGE